MIALRYGRFYLSCLAAFTGGHMVNYGVIMYAQDAIGSDLLSGIGFGLCFGPPIVLGWYAGVLCDRLAPGRLIHGAQAIELRKHAIGNPEAIGMQEERILQASNYATRWREEDDLEHAELRRWMQADYGGGLFGKPKQESDI